MTSKMRSCLLFLVGLWGQESSWRKESLRAWIAGVALGIASFIQTQESAAAHLRCVSQEPQVADSLMVQASFNVESYERLLAAYIDRLEASRAPGESAQDRTAPMAEPASAAEAVRLATFVFAMSHDERRLPTISALLEQEGRAEDAAEVRLYLQSPHWSSKHSREASVVAARRQAEFHWATENLPLAVELMLIKYAQGAGPEALFAAAEIFRYGGCDWEALTLYHRYLGVSHYPDYVDYIVSVHREALLHQLRASAEQHQHNLRTELSARAKLQRRQTALDPPAVASSLTPPASPPVSALPLFASAPRVLAEAPMPGPVDALLKRFELRLGLAILGRWLNFSATPNPTQCARFAQVSQPSELDAALNPVPTTCPSASSASSGLVINLRLFGGIWSVKGQRHRLGLTAEVVGLPMFNLCANGCGGTVEPYGRLEGGAAYDLTIPMSASSTLLQLTAILGVGHHRGFAGSLPEVDWPEFSLMYVHGRGAVAFSKVVRESLRLSLEGGLSLLIPFWFADSMTSVSLRTNEPGLGPVGQRWGVRPELTAELTLKKRVNVGLQLSFEHIELKYDMGDPALGNSIQNSAMPNAVLSRQDGHRARLLASSSQEDTLALVARVGVLL